MDTGAQDAALDDLLAELGTEAPQPRSAKKPKRDPPRKSLPEKPISRPPVRPRRETSYLPKPSAPATSRNPYSTKPAETKKSKKPPGKTLSH